MTGSEMGAEAVRLREAFLAANPGASLPTGADDAPLERLAGGFPGLVVPSELLDLLRVMNGSGSAWLLLDQIGPLLDADMIVTESRSRGSMDGDLSFSPGWVVITSEGWTYGAVVAGVDRRMRSAVIDLSYGNQAYPIVASSLTALVAASADAWELGIHEQQAFKTGSERFLETREARAALLNSRDARYSSGDGLATHDEVAPWQLAWPRFWPRPEHPDSLDIYPPDPISQVADTSQGIAHSVVEVVVEAIHDRWLHVRDVSGPGWIDVPPGLLDGKAVVVGSRWQVSVHPPSPFPLPAPPNGCAPTLRATGVLRPVR